MNQAQTFEDDAQEATGFPTQRTLIFRGAAQSCADDALLVHFTHDSSAYHTQAALNGLRALRAKMDAAEAELVGLLAARKPALDLIGGASA